MRFRCLWNAIKKVSRFILQITARDIAVYIPDPSRLHRRNFLVWSKPAFSRFPVSLSSFFLTLSATFCSSSACLLLLRSPYPIAFRFLAHQFHSFISLSYIRRLTTCSVLTHTALRWKEKKRILQKLFPVWTRLIFCHFASQVNVSIYSILIKNKIKCVKIKYCDKMWQNV